MSPRNNQARNVSPVDPNSFGARLRYYREEAGLSQEELGNITGIGQQRISTYELNRNTPSEEVIITLADTLKVPPAVLFETSRFRGALPIGPERRERLQRLQERDWALLDQAMAIIGDATPEDRDRFERKFAAFLTSWQES